MGKIIKIFIYIFSSLIMIIWLFAVFFYIIYMYWKNATDYYHYIDSVVINNDRYSLYEENFTFGMDGLYSNMI